jgi:hypothetical protein
LIDTPLPEGHAKKISTDTGPVDIFWGNKNSSFLLYFNNKQLFLVRAPANPYTGLVPVCAAKNFG